MLNKLRQEFKKGTILNKIIYINIGLFLFFSILSVFSFMFQFDIKTILNKLYLPADTTTLLQQPWTFITYMFLHNGFLHLLVNMLWLHFAGKIFLQYMQPKQLLSTYVLGGISGGLLFILAFNYIPALEELTLDARALGASASVLAIMVAIATYSPNYSVFFPLIGNVKLKKIAIVCPSTLPWLLKTVDNLWRVDKQSKTAQEIAKKASEMYDKVYGVYQSFDSASKAINNAKDKMKDLLKVKSDYEISEAYAEYWATILNSCFISYDILDDKGDYEQFGLYSEFCIQFERVFSLFQLVKIKILLMKLIQIGLGQLMPICKSLILKSLSQ